MLKALRNSFITGLVLLLPLGVTIIIINLLLNKVGAPTSKVFFWFIDPALRQQAWVNPLLDVVSTIVLVILIALLGFLSRYFLGRLLVSLTDKVLHAVPFINTVYKTVQQIVSTFSQEQRAVFQKTVLVQYPLKGSYALGFLTSVSKGEVQFKTGAEVVNVFVPTTPNPTSGFLLMVPREEVIELDMAVSDGMKLVISGGAVTPKYNPESQNQNQIDKEQKKTSRK